MNLNRRYEADKQVAIKRAICNIDGLPEDDLAEFIGEIKLMRLEVNEVEWHFDKSTYTFNLSSTLSHPNIVRFHGVTFLNENEICLVTELMTRGDLKSIIEESPGHLNWPLCRRLLKGVAKGM